MKVPHPLRSTRAWSLATGALLSLAFLNSSAQSQLVIQRVEVRTDGLLELDFSGDPASYYRLLSGTEVDRITAVVDLSLEPPLLAIPEGEPARFYRVQQIPRDASLDTDGDQIPDVYELLHPMLDPLDPTDAVMDVDGSGRTALQVYLDSIAPPVLTSIVETSPAHGAIGVSVHRETIFRFSAPLAPGTAVGPNQFFAQAGARRLLSRVELSPDRRQATLFYLEPIPSATRITVVFDGTGIEDVNGLEVDADRDGQPGGRGIITFNTFGSVGLPNTAVIGQVFASELGADEHGQPLNMPLQGVIVTVDGAEETLRAVTDAEGRFTLSPAPAGRFFVHIDGRTAQGSQWPNGAYYPFIGKAWEAVPDKLDNLAGGTGVIYLPLVAAGTLQPVSSTVDTVITFPSATLSAFPELEGVQVTVPANALFSNDGTRGGRIGIAPVPSDRLPEPLPPGLEMPLVITIQTDGPENFAQPVPVRFPNLPDPVTGRRLPPGAKTALVSFDHDTGVWEVSGPMTVSADGLFVDSDPGTGVRQPGWHGWAPVASGDGGGYGGGGSSGGAAGGGGGTGGDGPLPSFNPPSLTDLSPINLPTPDGSLAQSAPPPTSTAPTDVVSPTESGLGNDSPTAGLDEAQPPLLDLLEPYEDPEPGNGAESCGGLFGIETMVRRPFVGVGPHPPDQFMVPEPQFSDGGEVPYWVIPNQIVRVRFPVPQGGSVRYVATGGTPSTGTGPEFRTRFRPNVSVNLAPARITVFVTDADGVTTCGNVRFEVLPLSGAHWVRHYTTPGGIGELNQPFRSNVQGFVDALREAGAEVDVASTFRSQKRAYLMHMAARVKIEPEFALVPVVFQHNSISLHDPYQGPLEVTFAHLNPQGNLDKEKTGAAAAAMCSGYEINDPPDYPDTRLGDRAAVDLSIRWSGTPNFRLGPISTPLDNQANQQGYVAIEAQWCPSDRSGPAEQHCNSRLWQLGESWGVFKLTSEELRWTAHSR
jgi:hypothetical protein